MIFFSPPPLGVLIDLRRKICSTLYVRTTLTQFRQIIAETDVNHRIFLAVSNDRWLLDRGDNNNNKSSYKDKNFFSYLFEISDFQLSVRKVL